MKRSEALARIGLEIAQQGIENNIDDLTWLNVDYILQAIERAGMLPPSRQAISWEELGISSPNDSEKPRFKLNKWEPEE